MVVKCIKNIKTCNIDIVQTTQEKSPLSARKNVDGRMIIRLAESFTHNSNNCDKFLHVS